MTIFLILAILGLVFFVLGVALVFQGYRATPDPDEVVTKNELQKTQEGMKKAQDQESQLRLQLDALAVKLEEANGQLKEAKTIKDAWLETQSQENQQRAHRESLEENLRFLVQKSDTQAQEALDLINTLTAENENLRNQMMESAGKIDPQEIERLNTQNLILREQLEKNVSKIQELEGFLAKLKEESEQRTRVSIEAAKKIEVENQKLKQGFSSLTEKIAVVSQEIEREKQREEEAERQAQTARGHLEQANTQINQLQTALDTLAAEKDQYDRQVKDLQQRLRDVPDGTVWLVEKARLESQLREMQNNNIQLQGQEKLLASELKKSRAQALALESFCAGLQQQLAKTRS